MTATPDEAGAPDERPVPGRDLATAGFDLSLGDESTDGRAAMEAAGAYEGSETAPPPEE